jgi:hypothetical protein
MVTVTNEGVELAQLRHTAAITGGDIAEGVPVLDEVIDRFHDWLPFRLR